MPRVELIYDADCPNVAAARTALLRAFAESGAPPQWTEWLRSAPDAPARVRGYGSPTILVDGADVAAQPENDGRACCRVYVDANGAITRAPAAETIAAALARGAAPAKPSVPVPAEAGKAAWLSAVAALPGLGAAALPACPACWPLYAGVASAAGAGFLLDTRLQLPLTVALLSVAVASLGYRARVRRGFGPLALGLGASVVLVAGKFLLNVPPVAYVGGATLVAAALWHAWPRRDGSGMACPNPVQRREVPTP